MQITSLHIYPLKSTRGIDIRYAEVRERGLRGDRRWMIVDEHGNLITQREKAKLAQVLTRHTATHLRYKVRESRSAFGKYTDNTTCKATANNPPVVSTLPTRTGVAQICTGQHAHTRCPVEFGS